MMTREVNKLLLEDDLDSKRKLVRIFEKAINKDVQNEIKADLIEYIFSTDAAQRISNFDMVRLYGPRQGLSRYVSNQLLLAMNVTLKQHKVKILNDLKIVVDNLTESRNPLLKMTKARALLGQLETFLGDKFCRITYDRFLNIYFVPYENKIRNAAFDLNTHSIAIFKTKERNTQSPEYIFVHEFGHILHSTILKTSTEVPESFAEFNKKMNPKFFDYSREDQLEIYADLFSIAVMLNTDFEKLNPLIQAFKREHLEKITEYFKTEISRTLN